MTEISVNPITTLTNNIQTLKSYRYMQKYKVLFIVMYDYVRAGLPVMCDEATATDSARWHHLGARRVP